MKVFEREEMLINKGRREGREEGIKEGIRKGQNAELENTERERKRAEAAEREVIRLKKELEK